jgi:hypothetical protein
MRADTRELTELMFRNVPMLTADEAATRMTAYPGTARDGDWVRYLASRNVVFCVSHQQQDFYPGYQFAATGPKPVIAQLLAIFTSPYSRWDIAFWFIGPNGWLGGQSPLEVLDECPDLVLHAAEQFVLSDEY